MDWEFSLEPEPSPLVIREADDDRWSGGRQGRFDAQSERIMRFHQRVADSLIAPYSLDLERNLIVLRKGRQEVRDICAPLVVSGLIRSSKGEAAALRLEMLCDDGQIEFCDIPNDDLASSSPRSIALLRARGLYMPANAREMGAFLRSFRPRILRGADVPPGWHPSGKPIFGLRDGRAVADIAGLTSAADLPFTLFQHDHEALKLWGTQVARFASGNPYVIFALCVGLCGPILKILDRPGLGFNLAAPTSSGKTTVLKILEAMWPDLMIEGWAQTEASLEDICHAANGALLLLDEMPQSRVREVIDAVYFIINGRPRGVRAEFDKTSATTRPTNWSVPVFSTSEDPFEVLVKKSRGTSTGALLRLIDLRPDVIWKNLNGHQSAYDLIKRVELALGKTAGVAGPMFVYLLIKQHAKVLDVAPRLFESTLREIERTTEINRAEATGFQMRALESFACVLTAGQLGVKLGVIPLTQSEVRSGIFEVAQRWLSPDLPAETQSSAHQDTTERLRSWLAQNAGSKLVPLSEGSVAAGNRVVLGWRSEETYFLLKATMQSATKLQHGLGPFLEYLSACGILKRGGQPNSYQMRMGAGVHGRPWVYAIDREALENSTDVNSERAE
jgi:hypothetical protein